MMSDDLFTEQHPDEIEAPDPTDTGLWTAGEPDEERMMLAVPGLEKPALEVAFTPAQKELIKAINPGATPAELQVFMYQAARTGLDPIAKQIYLVKRDGKMAIQTGIDGFRLVGHRTGMIAGVDDAVFKEDEKGQLVSASVTIYRIAADGNRYPYTATAYWSEYAPTDIDAPAAFMWRKMRHTMLGKCAEALAWRKVCPAELSGVYTDDEMAQVDFGTLGQGKAEVLTEHHCPHCGAPVIDNREANANPPAGKKAQPAWKCSNQDCGGGGPKKDRSGNPTGEHWPWGSYDTGYFEPGGDGGDYYEGLTPAEVISVTTAPPASPDPEVLARVWDKGDAWTQLLKAMSNPPHGPAALQGQIAVELCHLMEQNGLWPKDSFKNLLAKWPQVEFWEQIPSAAAQKKFAADVFEAAKVKVTEKMGEG